MRRQAIVTVAWAAVALSSIIPDRAHAQAVGDGVALPDYEGVYLDPAGQLRTRQTLDEKAIESLRRRALAANPQRQRVAISLPKLLARAAQLQAKGEPLPDDVRYMQGLVQIDGLEIDPDAGDLRLTGLAEPIEKTVGHRALGASSGRPVIQLDDVVIALRLFAGDRWSTAVGCTIQLSPEGVARFVDEFNKRSTQIVAAKHRQRHDIAAALAAAAGEQDVKFIGQPGDTRFARVCVEADYLMKRLALGLDKPATPMPSYLSMVHKPDTIVDRFWFEQAHGPIAVSEDGRTVAIRGPALAVRTARHAADVNPTDESPAAERFAQIMTAKLDTLARFTPAFADLANLSDLALAAAIIGHERLDRRVGFDLAAAIDSARITVAKLDAPRTVPALANWNEHNQNLIFTAGGVRLQFTDAFAGRRDPEESD